MSRIQEQELSNILAVVNGEIKSFITAFCLDANPKTVDTLIEHAHAYTRLPYARARSNIETLLEKTLVSVGLVARSTIEGENTAAYALTEHGLTKGCKIAAFALRYAVDQARSLYSIFGATQSRGADRSPYRRFRILEECVPNDSWAIHDLAKLLDVDNGTMGVHCRALRREGFVAVASSRELHAEYTGKPIDEMLPQKAKEILLALKLGPKKASDLSTLGIARKKNTQFLIRMLMAAGYIVASFTGSDQTHVHLTPSGAAFKDEFIAPVRAFLNDETGPVQEAHMSFEHSFEERAAYAQLAVALYEEASSQFKRRPGEEQYNRILTCINEPMAAAEIAGQTGINPTNLRIYLYRLVKADKLKKHRDGIRWFYSKT